MSRPVTSLPSQISVVLRAREDAHRLTGNDTPGKIELTQVQLSDAAASLQWLADNREWIVEAVKARREGKA